MARWPLNTVHLVGLEELKGGPKALVTLKCSVWRSEPVGKQGVEGNLGGRACPDKGGHYQPLPISLPLAMEERARVDIIFY